MNNQTDFFFTALVILLVIIVAFILFVTYRLIRLYHLYQKYKLFIQDEKKKYGIKPMKRGTINPLIYRTESYFKIVKLDKKIINKQFFKYNTEMHTVFQKHAEKLANSHNISAGITETPSLSIKG